MYDNYNRSRLSPNKFLPLRLSLFHSLSFSLTESQLGLFNLLTFQSHRLLQMALTENLEYQTLALRGVLTL